MDTLETPLRWYGERNPSIDPAGIYQVLADLEHPCFITVTREGIGAAADGFATADGDGLPLLAAAQPLPRSGWARPPSSPRTACATPTWPVRWPAASRPPTW